MDLSSDDRAADAAAPSTAPTGWRLILRAGLWLVVAIAASFPIPMALGVAFAVTDLRHLVPAVDKLALYVLGAMLGMQSALLGIAGWLGRDAGMGGGPIARPRVVALLVGLLATYAFVVTLAMFDAAPRVLDRLVGSGLWTVPLTACLVIALAPLAEELFFRGWLWTGLRRAWGPVPTALATGTLWLAIHLFDGVERVPLLVPAAIALSLARHYGGSVRASLIVHVLNNLTSTAAPWLALWVGWLPWPRLVG